ncbi:MAG: IS4 family transposase [Gammaproteobacteria bacterium]
MALGHLPLQRVHLGLEHQVNRFMGCDYNIEVFHRTLKSGCRIEDRRLGNAESLQACLAIDLVVAWRVMDLTKRGRETPDIPCTVFFEEAEWQALACHHRQSPQPPETPPTLGEAMRRVAKLGGFLGRKGDGPPGGHRHLARPEPSDRHHRDLPHLLPFTPGRAVSTVSSVGNRQGRGAGDEGGPL